MSAHLRHEQHVNSLLAYYSGDGDKFSNREIKVLDAIRKLGRASDREVMLALGFQDTNAVRPRITELRDEGLIEEVGKQKDPVTGMTVRVLALARDPRKAQRQFEFAIEGAST
jgi:predicted MarR family transcription regulator